MPLPLANVQNIDTFSTWLNSHNQIISLAANNAVLSTYLQVANAATVATSGSYNDLTSLPNLGQYLQVANAATVATSGSYNDLTSLPNLGQYLQVANAATVATSGSYNDLSNLPDLDQYLQVANTGNLLSPYLQVANAVATYLPLAGGTITGNLTVDGNATFNGNTTIVTQTTIETQDALLHLAANNEFSDTLDIGFFGHFNDGVSNNHTGLIRDSGTKDYYLFGNYKPGPEPTNDININHASFATANLNVATLKATTGTFTGDVSAVNFNSTSDARLKININPIDNALSKVLQLAGVEFDWKDNNQRSIGVIAQQVEQVLPELVETSSNGYKSVSYGNLAALLIEAIKELKTIVDNK